MAGDLADADALAEIVGRTEPDWVIHLAAEIATQRDEARIREVNVEGTRRLLAAAPRGPGSASCSPRRSSPAMPAVRSWTRPRRFRSRPRTAPQA